MNARGLAIQVPLVAATVLVTLSQARAGSIWYVNSNAPPAGNGISWATAFQRVEEAVAAAALVADAQGNTDEIWIVQGTYFPPTNAGFVINKPLQLYGGFIGVETSHLHRLGSFQQTILDGDLLGTPANPLDNALHVVSTSGVSGTNGMPGLRIDGLLIRNGCAQGPGGVHGGGISSVQSDLDLFNCFLQYNSAPTQFNYGGGLYFTSGTAPTSSRLRIRDCEFKENSGEWGGGLFGDYLNGWIENTRFSLNHSQRYGGGAFLTRMGTSNKMVFANCVFNDNYCHQCCDGLTLLPLTEQGGGLCLWKTPGSTGGNAHVVNCTFVGNVALSAQVGSISPGMAIGVGSSSLLTISNSIVFFNLSDGHGNPPPIAGPATIDYSDVEGGWPSGNGNILGDPVFTLIGSSRYQLASTSPCLDRADYSQLELLADALDLDGDGDLLEPLSTDLELNKRIVDQPVTDFGIGSQGCSTCTYLDMGAYERP